MKKEEKTEMRECGYDKCKNKFKVSKENPQQEYCSDSCWEKAHAR